MSRVEYSARRPRLSSRRSQPYGVAFNAAVLIAFSGLGGIATASAATVSRSAVVQGRPSAVWKLIGPFCSISNWLPPVGTCSEDGAAPPTRTLVTKDGKATFVERQTARRDDRQFYSYTFLSSPLPVTRYNSTIRVSALGQGRSRVTWRGTYQATSGNERAAREALEQIYDAGLDSIRALAEQASAPVAATRATP